MSKNRLKYGFLIILAQTFVLICAAQQNLPSTSSGDIQFYLDDASFYNVNKVHHEFYIMVYADQLKLTPRNNALYADVTFQISAKNLQSGETIKDSWHTEVEFASETENREQMVFYDQWSKDFNEGNYSIEIELRDNLSGKTGLARRSFEIDLPVKEKYLLSDIQFVSEFILDDNTENVFKKGNVSVFPNPSRRYGILNPIMYFYFEIYNLDTTAANKVEVSYEILDKAGTSLRSFEGKTVYLPGVSSGVPNGINVSTLTSGIYTLVIKLAHEEEEVTRQSRDFEVIQIDYAHKEPLLSVEEAEIFGEIIRLISTERNFNLYNKLDQNGKAKFLVEFWRQNDPHPSSDGNELLKRIIQRFQYANKNFTWGNLDGWKSDRGKVLIKNGMPDNIERHASRGASFPFEIWEYQERRSYIYVFGDLRNDGRYTLLHSNKEGEVYNPYWKESLNR